MIDRLLYDAELPAIFAIISFCVGFGLGWLVRSGPEDPTT
jgi:hypothetical protein